MKTLETLKNERIIVELNQNAQKRIFGGNDSTETAPGRDADISGTYFLHPIIEE